MDVALDNNRSLRQTLLDIEAARAQYRIQRADRVPGLNAAATGNRQRQPADLSAGNRSEVASSYQVGLALPEYELDLFGRVKSLTDAALQQYLASEEAARAARIALVAEVSQAYLSYDGALRRLALTRQTLVSREYSFALIDQRRAAGAATALDYQEALGLVEQARAEQERNLRQKQQAFNALVLLLGSDDAAQAIPRSPGQRPKLLQDIAPGTPSELIERRPDILAAEHRLRARNADIGAARAAFFPRISLTGSFGTSSAEMSGLFDGGSRSWSFLPTLTLPIFDGGRNRANLSLAEARKDSAVAAYEGTIQTAFREVADALAASDTLRREEKALRALANSSNEALKLAKARYESGVDNHLRYLDAQRSSSSTRSPSSTAAPSGRSPWSTCSARSAEAGTRDGAWWYIEAAGVERVNVWETVLAGGNCRPLKGWQVVRGSTRHAGTAPPAWRTTRRWPRDRGARHRPCRRSGR